MLSLFMFHKIKRHCFFFFFIFFYSQLGLSFSYKEPEKTPLIVSLDTLYNYLIENTHKTYGQSTIGLNETIDYYKRAYRTIKSVKTQEGVNPYNLYQLLCYRIKLTPFAHWQEIGCQPMIQLLEDIEQKMIAKETEEFLKETESLFKACQDLHLKSTGQPFPLLSDKDFQEKDLTQRVAYLYQITQKSSFLKPSLIDKILDLNHCFQNGLIRYEHITRTSVLSIKNKRLASQY